jgi:hypothetical protein
VPVVAAVARWPSGSQARARLPAAACFWVRSPVGVVLELGDRAQQRPGAAVVVRPRQALAAVEDARPVAAVAGGFKAGMGIERGEGGRNERHPEQQDADGVLHGSEHQIVPSIQGVIQDGEFFQGEMFPGAALADAGGLLVKE